MLAICALFSEMDLVYMTTRPVATLCQWSCNSTCLEKTWM